MLVFRAPSVSTVLLVSVSVFIQCSHLTCDLLILPPLVLPLKHEFYKHSYLILVILVIIDNTDKCFAMCSTINKMFNLFA